MSEDFVVELWTYAGQRQEGKSVVWYDEKFEALVFKASAKTKGGAVGTQYEVKVERDEDGSFKTAYLPFNLKYVGSITEEGIEEGAEMILARQTKQIEEARERGEHLMFPGSRLSLDKWNLEDISARGAKSDKAAMNKIDRENANKIADMTVQEIRSSMLGMNQQQKRVILVKVMAMLGV